MKLLKKIFKSLPSMSLQVRLTLYFIIFGLLISYITFVVSRAFLTKRYINIVKKTAIPILEEFSKSSDRDFIKVIIGKKNSSMVRILDLLQKGFVSEFGKTEFLLYYFDSGIKSWKRIIYDRYNVFRGAKVPAAIINELNRAREENIFTPSNLFFGKNDVITFILKIPMPETGNKYLLKVNFSRQGVISAIKENLHRFFFAALILTIISMLLGKIFARRISKPIKKLSLMASDRASGRRNVEFTIDRKDEIGLLSRSLDIMTESIDAHLREIERRMNTMSTMNKIDKAVLSSISREDLLDRVIGFVSSLFKNSSVSMVLYDKNKKGFELLSQYRGEVRGILSERPFISLDEFGEDFLGKAQTPFQLTADSGDEALFAFMEKICGASSGSIINAPVFMDEKYTGSVILSKESPSVYTEKEIDAINMLADQVGVAMQSIITFEEKEKLLIGILMALTRSIDAKSKWTAGHSERVARFAGDIASYMKMDDGDAHILSFSAILHDIGKIGVPEFILDKPGKLSREEYAIIKLHPAEGARIIADIPSYERILPGVLYHHERWDGEGYPEGLRAEEIPVISRIITVADVFDAITSERPYRKGMNMDEAVNFMKDNKGKMFDAAIVDIFLQSLEARKK